MIVPEHEIELVNDGKRTLMLLPVGRGNGGEKLPCPIRAKACISLQPRPFVKGTKITVTTVEEWHSGDLTDTDGRRLGYPDLPRALAAFQHQHGIQENVWRVMFVLGDRTNFYFRHSERYLKRKGTGLTYDPDLAVHGEPAVTEEESLTIARKAHNARILADRERAKEQRVIIKIALGELRGLQLSREVAAEIRRAEWRLKKLDKLLEDNVQQAAA